MPTTSAHLTRIFWSLCAYISIKDHVLDITDITGNSMSPTLSPSYAETGRRDYVVWYKWNAPDDLHRGDIVHFTNPHKPEKLAVKRVIGVEGDTVILDARRRPKPVNGRESVFARGWDQWDGRAVVPQGHVWVEGDNWRKCLDSNDYGPVSRNLISGRAVAVVWPLGRFGMRPWEGFRSRTRVVEGEAKDWLEGVPVELSEVEKPHAAP